MPPSAKPAVGQPLQVAKGNAPAIQRTSSALDGPRHVVQETRVLNRRWLLVRCEATYQSCRPDTMNERSFNNVNHDNFKSHPGDGGAP